MVKNAGTRLKVSKDADALDEVAFGWVGVVYGCHDYCQMDIIANPE